MEEWKKDISDFHVKHNRMIGEVTDALTSTMDELKTYFAGSNYLKEIKVKQEGPVDETNPVWKIHIGGFCTEINPKLIKEERSRRTEEGHRIFDESVTVEDAIKKIISNEYKLKLR